MSTPDAGTGAQQRLVTLALRLRMAAEPSTQRGEPRTEMADAAAELMGVIDDLREISRGIHPAILSKAGLRPALRALGRHSAVPVELDVRVDRGFPSQSKSAPTMSSRRCSPTRRSTRGPRLSR